MVEAAEALARHPVDVLVVGSNANDAGDTAAATKYRSLEDQAASAFYGEAYWSSDGIPVNGWSPFADRKAGWQLLTEAICAVRNESAPPSAITFANYIPWGSRDLEELSARTDPKLLDRVVAFSDELFGDLLRVMRPRVVLVVKSLTDNKAVGSRTKLKEHRATTEKFSETYRDARGKKRFVLEVGEFELGDVRTRLVHLAHPSSWRIPVNERLPVKKLLVEVMR